jgi:hypothetical protein
MSLGVKLDGLVSGVVASHVAFTAVDAGLGIHEGDNLLLGQKLERGPKKNIKTSTARERSDEERAREIKKKAGKQIKKNFLLTF